MEKAIKPKREVWVDIVKGIAILAVVLQHTCQRTRYYFDLDSDFINTLNSGIVSCNMELFFLASGYVYFLASKKYLANVKDFIKTRFYDLMLPYLFLGPAIWLGKFLLSSFVKNPLTVDDLLNMFYHPIAFLWFIYVLFFVEIIVLLLDKVAKCNYWLVFVLLLAATFFAPLFSDAEAVAPRILKYSFWYYAGGLILKIRQNIAPPHITQYQFVQNCVSGNMAGLILAQ